MLSSVEFWPATGFPDQPWCEEPEVDAWVKSSRRVCEAYSNALAGRHLAASAARLRLMAGPSGDPDDAAGSGDVVVHAFAEVGFEGARVELPVVVKDLPPLVRARLVLDVIDCAMRQLGGSRDWSAEAIDSVRDAVLDSGFRFTWNGQELTSRDRRRAARTRFSLADDGYGRALVEITEKKSGDLIGTSAPLLAYSTIEGFKRAAKSLKWLDRDHVKIAHYVDVFGTDQRSATLSLQTDIQPERPVAVQIRPSRPQLAAMMPSVVLPPAARPRICGGSGGPMNDVPPLYQAATIWMFEHIPPPLTTWWAQTGLMELDVTFDFWGEKVGARLYRRGDDLHATFRRPMPDPEVARAR